MQADYALIIDVGMLVLLAATVFLAFRLTISLRNFKESRFEMEGLVNRLTANIDKAERAVQGMQNAARNAGKELDEIIGDAKKLSDELKFMNEAGDSLANRLEKLAERNRELVTRIEEAGSAETVATYSEAITVRSASPARDESFMGDLPRGFAIHDRDLDRGGDVFADEDDFGDDDSGYAAPGLQSQAERELFEALQNNKTRKAAGRRTQ